MLPLAPWSRVVLTCRRGRSRTFDLTLIRGPLSPLSYAPLPVGPEGLEPSPDGLKVRYAAITPRPHAWSGVCVSSGLRSTSVCSFLPVVTLRVELSTTRLSAVSGQPALGYRDCQRRCRSSRDGRTRTCDLVLPRHAGWPLPYTPSSSVRTAGLEPAISCTPSRRDSQTSLRSDFQQLVRESNPLRRLERAASCPVDERAVFGAHAERQVGREVLESSSPALQTGALPSQLPAQIKNPMSL